NIIPQNKTPNCLNYCAKILKRSTASKVGKFATYHHCTVLVDVDVIKLHQALHRDLNCIKSKATASTKAEVINLKTVCRDINVGDVIKTVADNYKLTYHVKEVLSVYPTEERFPGLNKIQENLMSWSWCFGHTPSFTVTKSFPICPSFSMWNSQNLPSSFEINLVCNKGTIECINIVPQLLDIQTFNRLSQYIMGFKFSDKIIDPLEMWVMDSKSKILCNYVKCCITQMIFDVHK
ncbi:lipoyl amidotransferase LIPT1, mitochondrial, partial [Parasteatoda tepidariorum]|uniref:lipoyl amidotransferase LIPT1, mitochondrial n=1 Tax=Parasteatoda tepidariorum TaxID=114398 RepID=UPI001C7284B9